MRLTISRYYTPTGRSIQRSYDKGNKDYYYDYYKRIQNGELSNEDRIEVADSLKFITPGGKIVYGGGGIIPDEFVPINLKMENQTTDRILLSGVLDYFVFEYLDEKRTSFQDITKEGFISNYEISDEVLKQFNDYYNSRARYKITFVAYADEIKLYMKGKMAEQLFGDEVYTQIINFNDSMLNRVNELIQN